MCVFQISGSVQVDSIFTEGPHDLMTEQHDTTPNSTPGWRGRAGAITRAITAVGAGLGYGYATHDVGQALTVTAVALSLLREAFGRPPQ